MIKHFKPIVGAVLFSILAGQAGAVSAELPLPSPVQASSALGDMRSFAGQFSPEVLAQEVVLGAERLVDGLLPATVRSSPSAGAAALTLAEPESGGGMMFLAALGIVGMIIRRQGGR